MTTSASVHFTRRDHGEATQNPVGGQIVRLATADETRGAFTLFENVIPARSSGPLAHRHLRHDEGFFVLAGALAIQVGERSIEATAGSFTFVPRGVVHRPSNPHDQPARFLLIFSPGGMDGFFADAATGAVPLQAVTSDPEALARLAAFSARYDFELAELPTTPCGA